MRRLTVLLLAVLLAFAWPGAARAEDGGGGDNAAVAINTKDGSSLFRFAFKIRRVAGDVVDQQNVAFAYASCTSCETTAIAIQIVLAIGDPETVTPTNLSVAINEECSLCETFASAYQFVIGTGGPVRFTAEGNKAIAEIRRAIRELADPALTPADRDAQLDALMDRLAEVLRTELVPAGTSEAEAPEDEPETTTATTPTTPATTETEPPPPTTTQTTPTTTETEPPTTTTETTP